jgi:hypothetical protein
MEQGGGQEDKEKGFLSPRLPFSLSPYPYSLLPFFLEPTRKGFVRYNRRSTSDGVVLTNSRFCLSNPIVSLI